MTDRAEIANRILDPNKREVALEEIVDSGATDFGDLAVRVLDDPRAEIRLLALKVVNQSNSIEDLSPVLDRLSDADETVRVEAIECVAAHGGQSEADRLALLLDDSAPLVRAYTGWALAEIAAGKFEGRIRSRLEAEESDLARAGMLEACVRLGGHREADLRCLAQLLESEDHQVRAFAANSLVGSATTQNAEYVRGILVQAIRAEQRPGIKGTLERNLAELEALLA
jgi:HEAT repeat protein